MIAYTHPLKRTVFAAAAVVWSLRNIALWRTVFVGVVSLLLKRRAARLLCATDAKNY
jgi:hypothetical protein